MIIMVEELKPITLTPKRVKLKNIELLSYYSTSLLLMVLPLINGFFLIKDHLLGQEESFQLVISGLPITYISLSISIFLFLTLSWQLSYSKIDGKIDDTVFKNVIKQTAEELEWKITNQSDNYVVAETAPERFMFKQGKRISILKNKNRILINSISSPIGYNPLPLLPFDHDIWKLKNNLNEHIKRM